MPNLGHRLGGMGPGSGNTIKSLQATVGKVSDPHFLYWEFDVHESVDGILFVYHDDDIEIDGEMVLVKNVEMQRLKIAGEQLGFKTTIPLDEGLRRMVEWWRQERGKLTVEQDVRWKE